MGRTNCPGDTDGRGQVVSMKEEEYPNLTTVAIIALMPAQGLMRGQGQHAVRCRDPNHHW